MPWKGEEMRLGDGVGQVVMECGGSLGVRQLEVGPCSGKLSPEKRILVRAI